MSIILINETHLGTEATRDNALAMVEELNRRGYNVEYGDTISHNREDEDEPGNANKIPDDVWMDALNTVITAE